MLRSYPKAAGQRRGNILIVTLLLLALFATIGLTIVYYTKDLAEQQRINIEAQSNGVLTFTDDGSGPFNALLSCLLYDTTSTTNAIWGQSLMRTMYGGQIGSTVPWNGVGTFHETVPAAGGLDRALLVNLAALGGALKPEISNSGAYVPKNAPYTYPDLKDFYLASFVPATGEVLVPSFHRQVAFGSLAPTNTNWTNATGKFLTPRPRPIDQSPAFPLVPPNADGSYTGDVQNLTGSFFFNGSQFVARMDSIWIDIGLPPMTLLNGKTVKPLVAPLILDLDALLNYSVHGNVYSGGIGTNPTSPSGAGLAPSEVNLVRAFPTDGPTLIQGRGTPQTASWNPASGNQTRSYNTRMPTGQQQPAYSAVSWNTGGGAAPGLTGLNLPGLNGNSFYATTPLYTPTAASPYFTGYDSTNQAVNYPAINYNPNEWPNTPNTSGLPQAYALSDLQPLLSQYCGTPYNYTSTTASSPGLLNLNSLNLLSIRGYAGYYASLTPPQQPPQFAYPYPSQPNYPPPQPTATTPSSYRLDPANLNRGLLTPYSWALDWPGLSPNFPNLTAANALALNPVSILTGGVLSNPTVASAFPPPTTPAGTISDIATGQWNNSRAALGPIDLNRPLADYRANTSAPLDPTNMAPANVKFGTSGTLASQAVIDRQQFAMSIFVRLIVASGAQASYYGAPGSPTYPNAIPNIGDSIYFPPGTTPAVGTPQFNALQALAQLAANIVDYIDSDDVSTAFVWNPAAANDPLNPINFSSLATIGNSVVFGVEKPRLVLNEAYGEVINDPTDAAFNNPQQPATKNPLVRFWLELLNPTSTAYQGGINAGPIPGNGSVTVRYASLPTPYSPYLIQIARSANYTGANGTIAPVLTGLSGLLRDPSNPNNPGNVTGGLLGATADLTFDFSAPGNNPAFLTVAPANGTPSTPTSGSTLVCAAALTTPTQPPNQPNANTPPNVPGFNPTLTGAVITGAAPAAGSLTSLTYNSLTLASAITNGNRLHDNLNQHVILLRRLANPYLPPNDPANTNPSFPYVSTNPFNPYITVDYMDYVPATDQILRTSTSKQNRTAGGVGGYAKNPASLGKVQPYAGWTTTTPTAKLQTGASPTSTGTYNFTFPNSLVLPQNPNPNPNPNTNAGGPPVLNTFGYANSVTPTAPTNPATGTYLPSIKPPGTGATATLLNATGTPETLMTPFDWLPHLDRTLLNQTELLQVSTGKPHEYTLRSIVPNALAGATDVTKFGYMATGMINSNANMLYRALDLLRIQPYGQMTAIGGRVPGRININTIQDKRVWDAWFDAQTWNTFTQNDVTNMWKQMIGSRTPSVLQTTNQRYSPSGTALTDTGGLSYVTPVPASSVYDVNGGTDRPFLPLGAPTFAAGGFAYGGGSGLLTDTLARGGSILTTPSNMGVGTSPYILSPTTNTLVPHPYVQAEALRKIMNNTTTVSHSFAVWVTVGYFDYNLPTPSTPATLGAEYYSVVPGDLRRKYFAVVDRSLVGLDPSTKAQSQNQPFFTTVDAVNVTAGSTTIVVTTSVTGTGQVNSVGPNGLSGNPTFINNQMPTGTAWIAIGTGPTQEIVQVTGVSQYPAPPKPPTLPPTPVPGVTLLTLSAPLNYPHWQGESVSNIIPGNPGPQPNFNYTQQPYNYVVPLSVRLQ